MGPQDPKNVARDTARNLSGHAAAETALVVQRSNYQRSLIGCLDCETREERWRGGLLSPSVGSTQVGTTPNLAFRSVVSLGGEVELNLALFSLAASVNPLSGELVVELPLSALLH